MLQRPFYLQIVQERRLAPSHREDEATLEDIEDEISNKTGTKWIAIVGLFDHLLMVAQDGLLSTSFSRDANLFLGTC